METIVNKDNTNREVLTGVNKQNIIFCKQCHREKKFSYCNLISDKKIMIIIIIMTRSMEYNFSIIKNGLR